MEVDEEITAQEPAADVGPSSSTTVSIIEVPNFPIHEPPPKSFVFFTERYFSQYVTRNCKGIEGNNVRLLLHSNGLCLVCIDPSHVVRSAKILQLSHSLKKERTEPIKCQGKRKKNALMCQKDMVLCFIDLEGGQQIRVPACVDGLILEINPYLVAKPELLQRAPLTEGFIAIVNPHAKMNFETMEKVSTATSGEMSLGEE